MDKEDQKKTHTTGHEKNHGVYVCNKCGWPFPNPHPSAKHRRAHKKICGTIEGYKLNVSDQRQTRFNGSDDEHFCDDDHKTPGLDVSTPKALDTGNNDKGNSGIGENLIRSEDEVFSDAVAHFSDSGLSPGVKECSQEDSLDTSSNVERVNEKDPKFSGSSEDNDFMDVSQLTVESTSDCQIQNPKILQIEKVEVGSTLELQSQLSGSTVVDPLSSSISVSRNEDLIVSLSDEAIELSTNSHPSKAEAMPENVTDFRLTSFAKEENLKDNDEIELNRDEAEIVVPCDNVVGEAFEEESKAFNLKEKDRAEFLSAPPQDDNLPVELNSVVVITTASPNDVQVESAHMMQFSTSGDVKISQEKGEGIVDANANADTPPTCEDRQDFKNQEEAVLSQNPLSLHSSVLNSEPVAAEKMTAEEWSEVSPVEITAEKSAVLYPDMRVVDGSSGLKEETHAEEHNEVSPTAEGNIKLDEISVSIDAVDTELQEPVEVKNPQLIGLPETTGVITLENISHHEKNKTELNDIAVDVKELDGNVEEDIGSKTKMLEVKQSSEICKSDDAGEMVKIGKCDIADVQCKERSILRDASSPNPASNDIESSVISEAKIDESKKETEGLKQEEISSNIKVDEECNRSIGTSAGSHEAQDSELLVKAAEDLARKYASLFSPSTEPAAQQDLAVKDDREEGDPSRNVSSNNLVKPGSSVTGIDASVDSGSRCDSLEANWGSFSVLSMLSDAPAVSTDAETLPSTGLLASSTEEAAVKSNLNKPKVSSESEIFEPPSFMSLVEPKRPMVLLSPQEVVSEPQKGQNPQQPNESQGRKNNEEIIAKITNWSTSTKEHTPLKSLLGEAAYDKNGEVPKNNNNGVGLTTVNSILGPESPPPSSQEAVKMGGETAREEWNSPARYPAHIKREKKRVKNRPYWIQLVCCSSVDPQRR